jgi:hypothetical protein
MSNQQYLWPLKVPDEKFCYLNAIAHHALNRQLPAPVCSIFEKRARGTTLIPVSDGEMIFPRLP